jgi:hypothetical protein
VEVVLAKSDATIAKGFRWPNVMRLFWFIASGGFLCGFLGCDFEDHFNANPCAALYDGDGFIALVNEKNELRSWGIAPRNFNAKMPLNPDTVDCGVIGAFLGFRNSPPVQSDSFAITLARAFYAVPRNASVKKLELSLENTISGKGSGLAHYVFDRAQLEKACSIERPKIPDSGNSYSLVSEQPMVINHGNGDTRRGISLTVMLERDQPDVYSLACSIKERYADRIHRDEIKEVHIEIRIKEPSCSLCSSQAYSFFFLEENGNL